MSLYNTKTLEPSPPAEEVLSVIAIALANRSVPARNRVMASPDSRSPDEGLAILQAYVSIDDQRTRQAILDLLIAVADIERYHR